MSTLLPFFISKDHSGCFWGRVYWVVNNFALLGIDSQVIRIGILKPEFSYKPVKDHDLLWSILAGSYCVVDFDNGQCDPMLLLPDNLLVEAGWIFTSLK